MTYASTPEISTEEKINLAESTLAQKISVAKNTTKKNSHLKKLALWIWDLFVGGILCHTLFLGIIVIGWTYRFMQRTALYVWWKNSPQREILSFDNFLQKMSILGGNKRGNWIFGYPTPEEPFLKRGITKLGHSLWKNFQIGFQGILNTWVLLLPTSAFWLASWHIGWNTSFNKVYEQATVGVTLGLFGTLLFMMLMVYVSLAQIRQAVVGKWRVFYEFRILWKIIRKKWFACFSLSLLYALVSLPVTIFKTAPTFFPQAFPHINNMSDADLLKWINHYFFWVCLICFTLYLFVHILSTKIYASAFLKLVQTREIPVEMLSTPEKKWFEALQLLPLDSPNKKNPWIQVIKAQTKRVTWIGGMFATCLLWFVFVSQIYLSEFLNYHPLRGWLNQPLLQIPAFRYVPEALESE